MYMNNVQISHEFWDRYLTLFTNKYFFFIIIDMGEDKKNCALGPNFIKSAPVYTTYIPSWDINKTQCYVRIFLQKVHK